MSRSITLGQYLPGEGLLYRLNARVKMIALLATLFILFLVDGFPALLVMIAGAFALLFANRIPVSYFLRSLKPVFMIALFAFLIYLFFTPGGVVLLRIGSFTIESRGLADGLFVVLRLFALVLYSLLLTLTTTPLSLTAAIAFFLRPLRFVGLPTEEVAMIMSIALRFIPTLMEESSRLLRAQQARGADFESGSLSRRAKSLVPLVVPLFISAFRRADELALAMEARGFRVGAERTSLKEERFTAADRSVLVLALAALVCAVWLIYF